MAHKTKTVEFLYTIDSESIDSTANSSAFLTPICEWGFEIKNDRRELSENVFPLFRLCSADTCALRKSSSPQRRTILFSMEWTIGSASAASNSLYSACLLLQIRSVAKAIVHKWAEIYKFKPINPQRQLIRHLIG